MSDSDPVSIATAFVQHYYDTFDRNREAIGSLYVRSGGAARTRSARAHATALLAARRVLPDVRDGELRRRRGHRGEAGRAWAVRRRGEAAARADGARCGGAQKIPAACSHEIQTLDVQPSVTDNALIVFVTGQLKVRAAAGEGARARC